MYRNLVDVVTLCAEARKRHPNAKFYFDWREYRTAHFVLATDVPRRRVPALAQQLEEVHALVVEALFGEPVQIPGRVRVVAFASARPFEELAPAGRSGYGLSAAGERWIVFRYDGRQPGSAFAHELTHVAQAQPGLPEGVARIIQKRQTYPDELFQWALSNYYGMVSNLDACVGRLLDELERLGLADDTILVFTSDHGDMVGSQGLKAKRWPYEESARVPFLIRYPRAIPAAAVVAGGAF